MNVTHFHFTVIIGAKWKTRHRSINVKKRKS